MSAAPTMTPKAPKRPSVAASTRRMQVVPYLAQKMPIAMIAALFKVDETTIKRWAKHKDVRAALGEVSAEIVSATKATATEIAESALVGLAELVEEAEDERVRLDAIKTALDRFGYPAVTKSEGHTTQDVRGLVVHFPSPEAARRAARGLPPETPADEEG